MSSVPIMSVLVGIKFPADHQPILDHLQKNSKFKLKTGSNPDIIKCIDNVFQKLSKSLVSVDCSNLALLNSSTIMEILTEDPDSKRVYSHLHIDEEKFYFIRQVKSAIENFDTSIKKPGGIFNFFHNHPQTRLDSIHNPIIAKLHNKIFENLSFYIEFTADIIDVGFSSDKRFVEEILQDNEELNELCERLKFINLIKRSLNDFVKPLRVEKIMSHLHHHQKTGLSVSPKSAIAKLVDNVFIEVSNGLVSTPGLTLANLEYFVEDTLKKSEAFRNLCEKIKLHDDKKSEYIKAIKHAISDLFKSPILVEESTLLIDPVNKEKTS